LQTTAAERRLTSAHSTAGWRLPGKAVDGLDVEVLEHEYHPWAIVVQRHPNFTNDLLQQRLFQALSKAL